MSTISFFKNKIFLILVVVLCTSMFSFANETTNEKTYVVTANRSKTEELKSNGNVTIITSEDIVKSGKTNLQEILQSATNVQISEGTYGNSTSIIKMRGAAGDNPFAQVVVLIDGRRLNNPDMVPHNLLSIPLTQIEKIEILDGGDSSLYGSGAIGGVINIITKEPSDGLTADAKISYGSYNSISANTEIGLGSEKFGINFSGDYSQSEGYRDYNRSKNWNANLKSFIKPNSNLSFVPFINYSAGKFELPGPLTEKEFLENPTQANSISKSSKDKGNFSIISTGLNSSFNITDSIKVEIPISYNLTNREYDNYGYSNYKFHLIESNPKLSFESSLSDIKFKSFIGYDFAFTNYFGSSFEEIERKDEINAYNIIQIENSPFVNLSFEFPFNLIFTTSARYTFAPIKATKEIVDFHKEQTYKSFDYSFGATYLFTENISIYSKYTTVFRIPFIDEKTSLTYFYGYHYADFNEELNPEKGFNAELGTNFKYKNLLSTKVNIFYMGMKDEIAYSSITFKNENLVKTQRIGGSILIDYKPLDFFKLKSSVSYIHAVFAEGENINKQIPLNAKLLTYSEVEFYLPFDFTICIDYSFTSSQFQGNDYSNSLTKIPAVNLLGATLKYTPSQLNNSLSVIARFNNILNVSYPEYVTYSSYYPAKQFNFNLSINYRY